MEDSTSTSKRRNKKDKVTADQGWTVVAAKPRFKRVRVTVPQLLVDDFTPLERAVYQVLQKAANSTTAAEMVEIIHNEMNCNKSDVGNVLYGRLKDYVEAENWKQRPRRWRLRQVKVKVTPGAE